MNGRAVGFEYGYSFWTDEEVISDEIASEYRSTVSKGNNVFMFEVRASFRVKGRIDKDEIVIGSERYGGLVFENVGERGLKAVISFRLQEYWMAEEETEKLVHEAFGFARQQLGSDSRLIPIVIGVDVCTVQREGEELEHTKERAIRPENLAPLCLWQAEYDETSKTDFYLGFYLVDELPRIRVEDEEKGLELMETCPVCLRDPFIGDQITLVPTCRHAFHSHCILRWLLNNNSCPLCRVQAYDYDQVEAYAYA